LLSDGEELSEEKNYFQFLENQKLNEESDFYSNSDQESENSLEKEWQQTIDYHDKPLSNQATHSQGNMLNSSMLNIYNKYTYIINCLQICRTNSDFGKNFGNISRNTS
jgi:hypothetical protein